jgi:gephyrin
MPPPSGNQTLRAAILIISDTAFADNSTDKAGLTLTDVFTTQSTTSWNVVETKIVPDDVGEIQRAVLGWTDGLLGEEGSAGVNCVITSGGTGFAVRDGTPEVSSFPVLVLQCLGFFRRIRASIGALHYHRHVCF